MTERLSKIDVPLSWPIELPDGKQIAKLTVNRPRGKIIKRVIALIGPEAIKSLMSGVDFADRENAKVTLASNVIAVLADYAKPEKLEELTEIIAVMTGQTSEVIDEVDPEDYPALFSSVAGFFPQLFSETGEGSQPT